MTTFTGKGAGVIRQYCPTCNAAPGYLCTWRNGRVRLRANSHDSRRRVARALRRADANARRFRNGELRAAILSVLVFAVSALALFMGITQ